MNNNYKYKNIAIFASGNGTNAEHIIKYFYYDPKIKVKALFSNNKRAKAMERAQNFGVPAYHFNRIDFYENNSVLYLLEDLDIHLIVLAGFLWKVPDSIINEFPHRIINIHPALLPKFGGKGMYGDNIHKAVINSKETESGITIHEVNNVYDGGEIVFQKKITVEKDDSPNSLAEKIHALEHKYYPETIEEYIHRLKIN